MAFTYTGDPAGSSRDKVRFLIQDTVNTGHLLEDEQSYQQARESFGVEQTGRVS